MAIADDTLKIPTITPESSERLKWFEKFLTYANLIDEEIMKNNQEGLKKTYDEWATWQSGNPFKGRMSKELWILDARIYTDEEYEDLDKWIKSKESEISLLGDYISPSFIIRNFIVKYNSKLKLPDDENHAQRSE